MVTKKADEASAPEVTAEPTAEVVEVISPLDQAKMKGAAIYGLIFDKSDEGKAKIYSILAEIKAIGDTVRADGGKAFDEATKAFWDDYEKAVKPFRDAYEAAVAPFNHLKGDPKAIGDYYGSLVETLGHNRPDVGDIPRFSNLGRPPVK